LGRFLLQFGSPGSGEGQFNGPYALAVDGWGNLYVSDLNNNRIQKFSSTGRFLFRFGSFGSGVGQFYNPSGLAWMTRATSTWPIWVINASSNSTLWAAFFPRSVAMGSFNAPYGVAVDGWGNLYVVDVENHCLQKFSARAASFPGSAALAAGMGSSTLLGGLWWTARVTFTWPIRTTTASSSLTPQAASFPDSAALAAGMGQFFYPSSVA